MTSKTVDSRASFEWAKRPDDERFLTLDDLHAHVAGRKRRQFTIAQPTNRLDVVPTEDGDILIEADDHGRRRQMTATHWSFGQTCQFAGGAPASWIRKLPAPLAAINLEFGLRNLRNAEGVLILGDEDGSVDRPGNPQVRAMTSQTYGRIWDVDVVEAVQRVNADGRWKVPAASYATKEPRRATTLYASDRDVFVFLVDPDHAIEIPGESEPLFRGFYVWNSEVGATTFGLRTFTYQRVCDNRTIWGISDVRELTIRHTGGAPQRFAYEGRRMLAQYATESAARVVEDVKAAQAKQIGTSPAEVTEWLASKGFTVQLAKRAVDAAVAERGGAGTVWDVVNGITAMARSMPHTNDRVDLETRAGKLLVQAAGRKN